jgi:hypothetical protein
LLTSVIGKPLAISVIPDTDHPVSGSWFEELVEGELVLVTDDEVMFHVKGREAVAERGIEGIDLRPPSKPRALRLFVSMLGNISARPDWAALLNITSVRIKFSSLTTTIEGNGIVVTHLLTKLLVSRNADPDGDAKASTWSRDSRRHAKGLTGVSQRMMLAEPVQADKCINTSQVPVC